MFRNYTPNISDFVLDQPKENNGHEMSAPPLANNDAYMHMLEGQYDRPSLGVDGGRPYFIPRRENSPSIRSFPGDQWGRAEEPLAPRGYLHPQPFAPMAKPSQLGSMQVPEWVPGAQHGVFLHNTLSFGKAKYEFQPEELKHEYSLFHEFKHNRLKQELELKQERGLKEFGSSELRQEPGMQELRQEVGIKDVGQEHALQHQHEAIPKEVEPYNKASKEAGPAAGIARLSKDEQRIIESYFSHDPQGRVKITAAFLNRRFAREREQFAKNKLVERMGQGSAPKQQLVLVSFKAGRLDVFLAGDRPVGPLESGSYVMVKADRGKDLGRVVEPSISLIKARYLKLLQVMELHTAFSDTGMDGISPHDFLQRNTAAVAEAWDFLAKTHSDKEKDRSNRQDSRHEKQEKAKAVQCPKVVVSLARPEDVQHIVSKRHDEDRVCRSLLDKIQAMDSDKERPMSQMELVDAEYQFDRKKLIVYYSTDRRIDFRDLVRELFKVYKTRIWMSAVNGRPYTRGRWKSRP